MRYAVGVWLGKLLVAFRFLALMICQALRYAGGARKLHPFGVRVREC